jgi:hypothetical protein
LRHGSFEFPFPCSLASTFPNKEEEACNFDPPPWGAFPCSDERKQSLVGWDSQNDAGILLEFWKRL